MAIKDFIAEADRRFASKPSWGRAEIKQVLLEVAVDQYQEQSGEDHKQVAITSESHGAPVLGSDKSKMHR